MVKETLTLLALLLIVRTAPASYSCAQVLKDPVITSRNWSQPNSSLTFRADKKQIEEFLKDVKTDPAKSMFEHAPDRNSRADGKYYLIPSEVRSEFGKNILMLAQAYLKQQTNYDWNIVRVYLNILPTADRVSPYIEIAILGLKKDSAEINETWQPWLKTNGRTILWAFSNSIVSGDTKADSKAKNKDLVYLNPDGQFVFDNQAAAIISSFPENIQLSRSLVSAERSAWLTNEPIENIASKRNYPYRLYFSYKFYKFQNQPYIFRILKSDLINLFERGLIEIGTYNFENLTKSSGVPDSSLTPSGLPIEIVFIGVEGFKAAKPMMIEGFNSPENQR